MTRTLSSLLALAVAAAAVTVSTGAPARADGGTYADLTTITFHDVAGDAPPGVDVRTGEVSLDPNLPYLDLSTTLGAEHDQPTFLVLGLGELVSGACEIRAELVSNRTWQSVVRDPGDSTLPPADSDGDADVNAFSRDARLDLVPTCAVLDLVDQQGAVLDSVAGVVSHAPAGRGTLRISHDPDAILNVDSGEESALGYEVRSASGPVYDVTVDAVAGDPGLVLDQTHVEHGDLGEPDQTSVYDVGRLRVTATPGLHTVTLRLSGGNAPTSEVTVTIWGRGGAPLPRRDSLAGRTFFAEDYRAKPSSSEWREWTAHAFLDDTWVRLSYRDTRDGTAPSPYQPCTRVTTACRRYAYDARSGAVQIGTDRGEVRDDVLRLNDLLDHPARAARRGTTVAFVGRNRFDPDPGSGHPSAYFGLTVRKDGTFTRVTRLQEAGVDATQRGHYRIGAHGLLVARTNQGKVVRTGMAFLLDEQGRPRPQLLGVYAFDVWFRPAQA